MTTSLQSQFFFAWLPFPVVSEIRFVGVGFYISLLVLWFLLQCLVWLAVRYSRLISDVDWWRSAALAFIATMVMIMAWSFPSLLGDIRQDDLIASMTSAMIAGIVAAWFLCGRLYRFELIHRAIVSVGVAILVLLSLEVGRIVQWKFFGS